MKKERIVAILLIVATVGFAVLAYCILPEVVVIQLSAGGNNTTAPKLIAVLLPAALGIGGSVASLADKTGKAGKRLLISAVGIALLLITMAVNCL